MQNKTPDQESFKFRRLGGEFLSRAARYAVEYVATPAAPGQEPLRVVVELVVQPGAPAGLEISGEGKVASALRPFALGEAAAWALVVVVALLLLLLLLVLEPLGSTPHCITG